MRIYLTITLLAIKLFINSYNLAGFIPILPILLIFYIYRKFTGLLLVFVNQLTFPTIQTDIYIFIINIYTNIRCI